MSIRKNDPVSIGYKIQIMKNTILILLTVFLLGSCNQNSSGRSADIADDLMMDQEAVTSTGHKLNSPQPPPLPPAEIKEVVKKKIIKDGRIRVEVEELVPAKIRIDTLVAKYGGYYANEQLNNSDLEMAYNLVIRIPSVNFETLISEIETGGGEIRYKAIAARDVTDQFIDLETRLANKRNYLNKYNELLKQAKTVKEILEIEEKIRGLEEEIESTTGRLKYLSDLVDYSTLDLEISKQKDFNYQPVKRDKFTNRLKNAMSKGWIGFVDFVVLMIRIWPFWIIIGSLVFILKKLKPKKNTGK